MTNYFIKISTCVGACGMEWKQLFKENILNGGQSYVDSGSVHNMKTMDGEISADVEGLENFHVEIHYDHDAITEMKCSCPYAKAGSNCKHMAAVLLLWKNPIVDNHSTGEVKDIEESIPLGNANTQISGMKENKLSAEDQIRFIRDAKTGLELSVESDDVITYAIQQNMAGIVRDICIKNTTEKDIDNLVVRVDSDTNLIEFFQVGVEKIGAGEELHLRNLKIKINGDYLASLTERITCSLCFYVCYDKEVLLYDKKDIIALAFDQWPGLRYTPELLAAFSMPNHPVVTNLLQLSAKYLEKWTGDPSLAGYQFKDPNRVVQMAAAAYAAIQQKNVTYANPPSSFEECGQRIRLADAVFEQHLGTCIDMTLLYVACLEAMGLNPIMVMMHGHIFAGVWLVDNSFSDTIMDDPTHLQKRMADGIYEIVVVECTAMCAGKTLDFEEAVKSAENNVSNYSDFEFVIDIARARSMGIRPLPVRIMTDSGFVVEHDDRREKDVTSAPTNMGKVIDLSNLGENEHVTKQLQWEHKLLDLSMRNMLINFRFTKAVVPLFCSNLSLLEDSLNDGEEFQVLPKPDNMSIKGEGISAEGLTELGPFQEFMELESRHKKLHTIYTESDLNGCLTKMYRSAKTSLEENGANTLYLALGLLRWVESGKDHTVRYAPIILLPIDVTRKPANKGYSMRMRDEDAQMNITLLEFLKQNFDVQIAGLNPLPTDEHGLDIPKIFTIIRHGVMDLGMWDVLEAGFIGNFSFSQFVMWNDIHNHREMLEKNNIVRSLMKGVIDWDCRIPAEVNGDEAYLPITADASQLRAINMAAGGVSYVLHGPPGTGKSQTITAMISNALTKGKTVLFVAEKMAALEVVQRRLDAIGISDFCLELHSNKATKKAVLDQLRKTLELGENGSKTDYDQKIKDIRGMRSDLDAYVKALHKRRAFGKSIRELIDLYEMIPDHGIELRFTSEYAGTLTQSSLDNQKRLLEQLIAAGRGIGHPQGHPLSAVGQTVYTQTLKMDLEETVTGYRNALEELCSSMRRFFNQLEISMPCTEEEWGNARTYAENIISAESIPNIILSSKNIDEDFDLPLSYATEQYELEAKMFILLGKWNETFIHMDMTSYHTKYDDANKKLFGKGKALSNLVAEVQSFASFRVSMEQIPALLAEVEVYQKQEASFEAKKNGISFEWRQIIETCGSSDKLQEYKEDVKRQLVLLGQFTSQIRKLKHEDRFSECMDTAREVLGSFDNLKEKEMKLVDLLALSFDDAEKDWINGRERLCDCLISNASNIKDWIVFKQFDELCRKAGLTPVCDAYANGLPHEQVMDVYYKSIYNAIILSVIESEPVLNRFTGNGFNERIVQFKKLDAEFMELTKEETYYKLTHQLPTGFESVEISKELNILRRAISSNGRGLSIRTLFEQIPDVLKKLSPCMLMSPISVAQYLSVNSEDYDVVIFDEASQLPTCKAVGVLARGKNAVIVGDPNQMPPTSFFAGNTVDEDNLDIEDLNSILDDCLALGMPSAHLQWHYRSRHESLIAFSNHEFYEDSMLTFPSVNDREKRVSMKKVDGFFDRNKGRINESEAKAIIEEIKRRFKDDELKNQSIGVVTFNISQQTLIEDMLQVEFSKNLEFDKWANIGDEKLFVKNLENVQGDERDVILFSVAYGPDEENKLSMNFGPLNKVGGWKRLNVAVSRARSEMVVFSIMVAEMIDLKRTKAKGVESLKNFLAYAEKGKLQFSYVQEQKAEKNQGILDCICKQLEKAGYQYQKGVGHSKFKVDIAVVDPYNRDNYLMGILLDGDSYRQSANTKDREVAQISVLKGLGWDIHRIWTMDWWDNKQKEIDKLLSLLDNEKKAVANSANYGNSIKSIPEVKFESANEDKKETEPEETTAQETAIVNEEIPKIVVAEVQKPQDLTIEVRSEQEIERVLINPKGPEMQTKIADVKETVQDSVIGVNPIAKYFVENYETVNFAAESMPTSEYILKENMNNITEKLQLMVDVEAPISQDRLVKRILRAFDIGRSSDQTIQATEKALKNTLAKPLKQNGTKFYWREDQDPDTYSIFRNDLELADRRSLNDICQQEFKNAICATIQENGALAKDDLIKAVIRTMGYSRSGAALVEAVEKGIKYGRKSGEIILGEDKKFILANHVSEYA